MSFVSDPYSGLQFLDLSHPWDHGVPSYPGQDDVKMFRSVKHAQHGVLAWKINTVMHTGTHMNAPIHMIQKGADLSEVPEDRFFGNGVVLGIPKEKFEVITAKDLEAAEPGVKNGDIVVIVTGWHHKYSDSLEYFGESPGLSKDAAEWLVEKDCKLVAVDSPQGLKGIVGKDIISLKSDDNYQAAEELKRRYEIDAIRDGDDLTFEVASGEEFLPAFIREFDIRILSVSLRRPSLDDVFLKLTGRAMREEEVTDNFKAIVRQHGRRLRH